MSELICLDEVNSTNSYLKARADELPSGTAVTARLQTAGRGRHGHDWLADEGMLPLSVLLKNPISPETLTLRVGVAVCEAIEAAYGGSLDAGIKWPNDVIIDSYKVSGILCESMRFGDDIDIICGIGVNLTQPKSFFASRGIPHGASLADLTGTAPDRIALAKGIARRICELSQTDFTQVYERYKRRCVTIGRQVRIIGANGERTAFAEDIAQNGFLICESGVERFEVSSGEVSVRGLMDYV